MIWEECKASFKTFHNIWWYLGTFDYFSRQNCVVYHMPEHWARVGIGVQADTCWNRPSLVMIFYDIEKVLLVQQCQKTTMFFSAHDLSYDFSPFPIVIMVHKFTDSEWRALIFSKILLWLPWNPLEYGMLGVEIWWSQSRLLILNRSWEFCGDIILTCANLVNISEPDIKLGSRWRICCEYSDVYWEKN